jgi:hypothetical protein
MGYNMGLRLIEDFLAKSNTGLCSNFRETAEMISKVGFKIFMNITPAVTNWSQDGKSFNLVFEENPLADFVELPDDGRAQDELWYSNILCGVIRGTLEMVGCAGSAEAWTGADRYNRCKCRLRRTSSATFYVATTRQRCGSRWYGTSKTRCLLMMNKRLNEPDRTCVPIALNSYSILVPVQRPRFLHPYQRYGMARGRENGRKQLEAVAFGL